MQLATNKPLYEVQEDEWLRTFAVNTHGTFNLCRRFARGMIDSGWGRIVNIASKAGEDRQTRS